MKKKNLLLVIATLIFLSIAGYFALDYVAEQAALSVPKETKILQVEVVLREKGDNPGYAGSVMCPADGTPKGGEYCRLKTMSQCLREARKEEGLWRAAGDLPEVLDPGERVEVWYTGCGEQEVLWLFLLTEHYQGEIGV